MRSTTLDWGDSIKKHALILCFDDASDQRIRDYWQQTVSDFPQRNMPPHVTIGIFSDIPLDRANDTLQTAAQEITAFSLQFSAIGAFISPNKYLYLAPTVTKELLALHERLHKKFAFCNSDEFSYYRPDNWVPHCTIASAKTAIELAVAMGILAQVHESFTAQVTRMAWIEVAQQVRVESCYDLLPQGEII